MKRLRVDLRVAVLQPAMRKRGSSKPVVHWGLGSSDAMIVTSAQVFKISRFDIIELQVDVPMLKY